MREPGSGTIYSLSAFAHGYRHGYEEGYHNGNLDINMGRHARTRKTLFQGVSFVYSSELGSKNSFEAGFRAGVAAGYGDGFAGRTFRAIDSAKALVATLDSAPPFPRDDAFDRGLANGYGDGFDHKRASTGPLDFHSVGCPEPASDKATDKDLVRGTYCDGYRRGFVLGHTDAQVMNSSHGALEASK